MTANVLLFYQLTRVLSNCTTSLYTAKGLFVPRATFFFKMPAAALVMCIARQRVVYALAKDGHKCFFMFRSQFRMTSICEPPPM